MAFDDLQSFLAMGGYALYVWLSFAVWLVSVLLMIILTAWQARRIHRHIQQSVLREQRLRQHRQRQRQEE
jgi:heme exporter protein D